MPGVQARLNGLLTPWLRFEEKLGLSSLLAVWRKPAAPQPVTPPLSRLR